MDCGLNNILLDDITRSSTGMDLLVSGKYNYSV